MRDRLITMLAAVAALVLVIFLLSPPQSGGQKKISLPTTEDRGNNGLKGLFAWLQSGGIPVASLRHRYSGLLKDPSLPPQGNVLLASLPSPEKIAKSEWSALANWLDRGNSLIIMGAVYYQPDWVQGDDCFCEVKTFLARYQWTLHDDSVVTAEEEEGEEAKPTGQKTAPKPKPKPKTFQETVTDLKTKLSDQFPENRQLWPLAPIPLLDHVKTLATHITPLRQSGHWTLSSDDKGNIALRLLGLEGKKGDGDGSPAAWQIKVGGGQVILLLTPDLFSNAQLNQADNAQFFNNLMAQSLAPSGRLLFDDYHFGLSELYDPAHFFKDPRLHGSLWFLALLWLFYLIGHTNRLAPVRPTANKQSAQDFIDMTANFFARRLDKRLLAEALAKQLLQELCRRRHLADEAAALAWLEWHSQVTALQLGLVRQACALQAVPLADLTNTLIEIRTVTL